MVPPCVAFGASPPGGRHQRTGGDGSAVSAGTRWRPVGAAAMLFALAGAWAQEAHAQGARTHGAVPQPVIEMARGGQCVADAAFMRRNHMKLLKHQRDDTLRGGVRTGLYSLKACIGCHASQTTGSVNASSANFCQSCHAYAAVKIDCFECHASHAPSGPVAPAATQGKP